MCLFSRLMEKDGEDPLWRPWLQVILIFTAHDAISIELLTTDFWEKTFLFVTLTQ